MYTYILISPGILTGRDDGNSANVNPYVADYSMPSPISKTYSLSCNVNITVTLPFLSNKTDLAVGELLMLPFDGGCADMYSSPPALYLAEFKPGLA